jgi:hypothetical protein
MTMDDFTSTNEEAVAAAAETAPVPVELSPEEQAAIQKILADQAAAEAEAARLAAIEADRQAQVVIQIPNAVKLMRQRWSGVEDEALVAALGGIDPEAYQKARAIFEAEIAEYHRTNQPQAGAVAPGGPMPAPEQPKAKRARR